ncbi:MAG TPA: MFS transporter [Candidatus Aquilonibacter sp.]|nr:MFS transporter [Candidatus Aquilonibacter sp.]
MEFPGHFRRLTSGQRKTFFACFLGWSLDAFDFFTLVLCLNAISTQFHARVSQVSEAIFWTLAMRPLGAFVFGVMADRFGRRPTLILNILTYSGFELASAFAPSLKVFLVTRALFGIAMGGEWGVGAALAFETLPTKGRGFFSGLLQEGYVVGYLVAALAYGILFPVFGWRGMFVIGAPPGLLVAYLLTKLEESPAWQQKRVRDAESRLGRDILTYLGSFSFLVVLMFALNALSHGTQDLYPTFLERNLHFQPRSVSVIVVTYNFGALLGGICFGTWSEAIGRRRAIVIAALCAIPAIPLWAYSHSVPLLALGGFIMQFMVQGAWGVIPAHLNELSPPAVRGTFPGFAYQLGNLLASRNSVIQARLVERHYGGAYPPMLAWTVLIIASMVAVVTWSGKERRGSDLSNTS